MNFADIETLWRSPHNRPTPAQMEKIKMKFDTDLRRRRRGFMIFIALVIGVLSATTAALVVHALRAGPAGTGIDFSEEWGALVLLVLPWGAAILFLIQHRRHRMRYAEGEQTIGASVRALLDENRLGRVRLKWIGGLHGALLLVLPIVAFQLRAVGKAGDEILVPAFVLWPLIAAGILCGLAYYDRATLLPRKRELEVLLKSYE